MSAAPEVHEFQAETRQLLDLMVHSIYSNKDSFLRELISNASDALDKLRLESLLDKDLDVDTSDLHITLTPDSDARTLVVADNGIGMTRDEVVGLIGTLARSGTAEIRRSLAEAREKGVSDAAAEELIGQFGIGFYSTFMVADKVSLVTRKAGETTGTRWESTGDGTYTIDDVPDAPQGTSVTLALKPVDTEDHLYDYADKSKLRQLVKRYSDFIAWPIRMDVEKTVPVETPGSDTESDEDKTPPETKTIVEEETINSMKALWPSRVRRSPTRSTRSSTGTCPTPGMRRWRPSPCRPREPSSTRRCCSSRRSRRSTCSCATARSASTSM